MKLSALSWPNSATAIQTSAESVTGSVDGAMASALQKLSAIESNANYNRHPLSNEAENLLGLRIDLETLLNQGKVITVSPYQFQVGNQQTAGRYLNPQTAINILASKMRDQVDKNRPIGGQYCIAIMVSESQLSKFSSVLNSLTAVLALPDWCQVARQATALSTNTVDKLYQPAAIIQPRFKPQANLNASPLREYLKKQSAQIATLESLANDKTNVIGKLQALAAKRTAKLNALKADLTALASLTGSVYSMAISGNSESIATQLSQATAPNNNQYTVASLLLSSQPLTFFEELLCSA